MTKVCRMPSYNTEPLKFESYTTTPRSTVIESSTGNPISQDSEVETDNSISPSSRDVVNRVGAHSAPSHFSPQVSQSLTRKLVDNSEQCALEDVLVFDTSVVDDWGEAASGWGVVVPYPKYIGQPPPAPHKSQSVAKKSGSGGSGRMAVRCVDEDFGGEYMIPAWKGNVEPVTYRYVPNNGYYRTHKILREVREWPVMKKSKTERSRLTPELRYARKTLKRDLDNRFRSTSEYTPCSQNIPMMARMAVTAQEISGRTQQSAAEQRDHACEIVSISKRLPAREQQLMKSASDLFMEKFNTRLSALEKEIQIPFASGPSKKITESSSAPNHSPTHLSKKLKEVRVPETAKPTIQSTKQHGSDFGEDLFTIIPMCKREVPLRPLEKLTPKQKQMEKASSFSQERSPTPEPQSGEEDDEDLMIVLACASSQPQALPKDTDSNDISTARSAIAMTNIDIEKMRNIPLRSEFGGKPKPFLVQKEGGAVAAKGTMRYTVTGTGCSGQTCEQGADGEGVDRKDLLPSVDRPLDTKLGSTLPEIMGKRLSVIAATHRLL